MAPPDPKTRLRNILAAAVDLKSFVAGMTLKVFERLPENDHKTYRAIKNAVSEIGESVKSLPPTIYDRHPGIDWRGFAGLRDVVIHQYFDVDLVRLWSVLIDELPALVKAIEAELKDS